MVNEGDAPFFGTPADFARFKGHIQLSRFKWAGSTIDLRSEQKILQVPVDRGICCHVGGDIVFDGDGNLFLSTGDDTNPFESDGYAPIDERASRNPAFDAQRTSANTNDLRGKVLRIKVGASGGYTIPEGNLFVDADPLTRPEIYVMGLRNPFRIEFNREPASSTSPTTRRTRRPRTRCAGPAGQGKWTMVTEPGNYGWPYCATAELPYIDYDFATGASGAPFNCAAPVNESPHNTGRRRAAAGHPAARLVHRTARRRSSPQLGTGGIGPMAGPAYQFDAKLATKKGSTRLAGLLRQRPALLRVDARLHQGVLLVGRDRDADRGRARRRSTSTTRSTSSSGLTGRCTCSSTATASSARTCRAPSSPGSTSSAPRATAPRA